MPAAGRVGMGSFSVLPQVTPRATFLLVLLAMLPCLASLWRSPAPTRLARAVAYASLCGFMFGWHVHEKAALHIVLPLALCAAVPGPGGASDARRFVVLSSAAHVGMFPLLWGLAELPIKWCLAALYALVACSGLAALHGTGAEGGAAPGLGLAAWQWAYLLGLVAVELYAAVVHPLVLGAEVLPFLPLMATSVYCALGVSWVWVDMAAQYVRESAVWGAIHPHGSSGSRRALGRRDKAQ
jgi:alpha-1,3-glucosyltransferase